MQGDGSGNPVFANERLSNLGGFFSSGMYRIIGPVLAPPRKLFANPIQGPGCPGALWASRYNFIYTLNYRNFMGDGMPVPALALPARHPKK
jgi:hypothetical protein